MSVRNDYARFVVMAEDILEQLFQLPEDERTQLAIALLDSVDSFDPHADLSTDEFHAEIHQRAAEARAKPEEGTDWANLRARLERDPHV